MRRPSIAKLLFVAPFIARCVTTTPTVVAPASATREVRVRPVIAPSRSYTVPDRVEDLPAFAAEGACRALFRCCESREAKRHRLGTFVTNPRLPAVLRDQLPGVDEADCRSLLTDVYRLAPFGDWIDAVRRGEAEYSPDGAAKCRAQLESAGCGVALGALFDPRCMGHYDSPWGRRMFRALGREGDGCRYLIENQYPNPSLDTCDHDAAWCCFPDPSRAGGCMPTIEAHVRHVILGTCRRASRLGEWCSNGTYRDRDLQRCVAGLHCGDLSHRCLRNDYFTPRAIGEPCVDRFDGVSLGACPPHSLCDSYRSLGEGIPTYVCVATLPAGSPCTRRGECESHRCEGGVCAEREPVPACADEQPGR